MKNVIRFGAAIVLIVAPFALNAQISIPDIDPPEVGLCRCHTAGDNECLGGNTISLRPRCGDAPGCAPGGPC